MYKVVLAGILIGLAASKALAAAGSTQVLDLKRSAFAEQRLQIEKQLADGKTYAEISSADRDKVKTALSRIAYELESAGSSDALTEVQKTEVFNDQELVNNILTRAGSESRLICTREKKIGSHRPITQCLSVAERRRMMEQSQDALRNAPPPQLKSGG